MSTPDWFISMDQMDLADVLRNRRAALGMSQAELARSAGVSTRQIVRYEAGEQQPVLSVALKIADVLDISIAELAGREQHRVDLSGDWWAAWQTYQDGREYITAHELRIRQQADYLQVDGSHRPGSLEEGWYSWRGELRLWDGEILMGWYVASEAAVRSKGTLYFKLHPHGMHAIGRWVGLSYDGDLVTGLGAIARTEDDVRQVIHDLINQQGDPWTRSVT